MDAGAGGSRGASKGGSDLAQEIAAAVISDLARASSSASNGWQGRCRRRQQSGSVQAAARAHAIGTGGRASGRAAATALAASPPECRRHGRRRRGGGVVLGVGDASPQRSPSDAHHTAADANTADANTADATADDAAVAAAAAAPSSPVAGDRLSAIAAAGGILPLVGFVTSGSAIGQTRRRRAAPPRQRRREQSAGDRQGQWHRAARPDAGRRLPVGVAAADALAHLAVGNAENQAQIAEAGGAPRAALRRWRAARAAHALRLLARDQRVRRCAWSTRAPSRRW